ncbi:MAG: gfo/Idh/MocA family oxidoreductase, partial [Planctomycetaceae bacterium]
MTTISRRQLLGYAAAAGVGVPYVIPSRLRGQTEAAPSERITMGAIGLGNQGLHNLKSFLTFDDVRVLAVCDV